MIKDFFKKKLRQKEPVPYKIPILNEKYLKTVKVISIFKYIAFSVLIVFSLVSLTVFSEEITSESIRYVIKELGVTIPDTSENAKSISYTADSGASYGIFRSDLVIAQKGKLEIISQSGKTVLKKDVPYNNPTLKCCDDYFIIYDVSGNSFSVYNSFSELYSESLDYPISSIKVSSDSTFAIITRYEQYRSAIIVYNEKFKPIYRWYSNDKYVFDLFLDNHGMTLCTSCTESGNFKTKLYKASFDKEKINEIYTCEGAVIDSGDFEDSGFFILSEKEILCFSKDYTVKNSKSVGYSTPLCSANDKTLLSCIYSSKSVTSTDYIIIYNSEKNSFLQIDIKPGAKNLYVHEGNIYILYENEIVRIDESNDTQHIYSIKNLTHSLIFSNGKIFALQDGCAEIISIKDLK